MVTFCYVDGNLSKPAGFDTHLLEYRDLFARVESVQSVCVDRLKDVREGRTHLSTPLRDASSKICEGDVGSGALTRALSRSRSPEKRETACFNKQQLDRLRDELREFQGTEHEELHKIWREHGDGAGLCGMQGLSTGLASLPRIGSTTTTGSSAHFPGGAGMKRTDCFRRQQGPHKDPGLNAVVAGFARNDTTGCRRAMLRETRTAKQFKGGSDPGLCGPEPPQTRFVPTVTSGVTPALEELPSVMHPSSDENLESVDRNAVRLGARNHEILVHSPKN